MFKRITYEEFMLCTSTDVRARFYGDFLRYGAKSAKEHYQQGYDYWSTLVDLKQVRRYKLEKLERNGNDD